VKYYGNYDEDGFPCGSNKSQIETALDSVCQANNNEVIVMCKAEDLIDEGILNKIRRHCFAVTSCFSISHFPGVLSSFANNGIPIIGCVYIYDDASADGTIIDEHGILMKKISDNEATVKWDNDTFIEYPVTTSTLSSSSSIINKRCDNLIFGDYDDFTIKVLSRIAVFGSRTLLS
jgi:hypothetical protein